MLLRKLALCSVILAVASPASAQSPRHTVIPMVIQAPPATAEPPPGFLPPVVVQRDGAGAFTCGFQSFQGDVIPGPCMPDAMPHVFTDPDGTTGHVTFLPGGTPVVTKP